MTHAEALAALDDMLDAYDAYVAGEAPSNGFILLRERIIEEMVEQ